MTTTTTTTKETPSLFRLIDSDSKDELEAQLSSSGEDPNQTEETTYGYRISLLVYAIESRKIDICRILLKHGADPNFSGNSANPLRSCDEVEKYTEFIKLLIEHGANIETPMFFDCTLLHLCSGIGRDETMCQFLIERGAIVDSLDIKNKTPLCIASEFGNYKVCQILIKAGANPNYLTKSGYGPIYAACLRNDEEICKLLISSGADINGNKKRTPLSCAIFKKNMRVIEVLISSGADVNLIGSFGCPLEHARNMCNMPIFMTILRHCNVWLPHKKFKGDYGKEFEKEKKKRRASRELLLLERTFNPSSPFSQYVLHLEIFKLILKEALLW